MKLKHFSISFCLAVWLGGALAVHAGVSTAVSNRFALDTRAQASSLHGSVWLSPVAETEVPSPQLTVDGQPAVGWSKANPYWDTTQVADGWHTFVLTERNKSFEAKLLVLNQPAIHTGALAANETWAADKVHLATFPVTVPAGVTLTIADNAVVKFFDGASLTVEEGGKLVLGRCVLTHLADDSAGGDTNDDGEASSPADASYELVLNGEVVTTGIQPDLRYAKRTGLVRQLSTADCQAGTPLALAGQPVTLAADYSGTLDGYRLGWFSSVPGVRFEAVEGNPYQAVFTMPDRDVTVECVLQWIMSTSEWSAWGTVDTRTTFGGQLFSGTRRVARMARKLDANAYVELLERDGDFAGEIATESWNSAAVADARYTATIYEGDKSYSASMAVRNDASIAVHGGLLGASESWSADQVHIVQYIVRVPSGKTLTVAANAVVKVCPGAGFIVDEGGRLALGDGCVVTDIADDSAGGDTNLDAEETAPSEEENTTFEVADEEGLENEGTPEIRVKAPIERAIALQPGWNAVVFDFALDDASAASLQMFSAMELDAEQMTYVRSAEFLPNRLYWVYVTRTTTLRVKGRQEVEELPAEALTSWVSYGNAYGVVPEGSEIYEWRDGQFLRFFGTQFVPGRGYFLRKRE